VGTARGAHRDPGTKLQAVELNLKSTYRRSAHIQNIDGETPL